MNNFKVTGEPSNPPDVEVTKIKISRLALRLSIYFSKSYISFCYSQTFHKSLRLLVGRRISGSTTQVSDVRIVLCI
jgi:hypothetical protein